MAITKKQNQPTNNGMPKKADVIIQTEREMSYKIDRLLQQTSVNASAIRGDVAMVLKRCDQVIAHSSKLVNDSAFAARQNTEICKKLMEENNVLKQELKRVSEQSQQICEQVTSENAKLKQELQYMATHNACLFEKLTEAINAVAQKVEEAFANVDVVDYDKITEVIADAVPVQEVISADYIATKVAEQILIPEPLATIDEEAFAETVANRLNAEKIDEEAFADTVAAKLVVPQPVVNFDEDGIAEIVANKVLAKLAEEDEKAWAEWAEQEAAEQAAEETVEEPVEEAEEAAEEEVVEETLVIDYDELAKKVAEVIPVQEPVSVDDIAARIIEQINIPAPQEVDYDKIAQTVLDKLEDKKVGEEVVEEALVIDYDDFAKKVAEAVPVQEPVSADDIAARIIEQINIPAPQEVDYDKIAQTVLDKLEVVEVDEDKIATTVADKLAEVEEEVVEEEVAPAAPQIDVDELADTIAKKVGDLTPNDFEIIVDDAGCESISNIVAEKLDYDLLASKICTKIFESGALNNEPDYEEIATQLAEKVAVPTLNEEAIADKAAAILSNYLPEFDTDGVADKLSGVILPVIPAAPTVDTDEISEKVAEKIIENQEKAEFDIVLDDEGICKITNIVSDEVKQANEERFNKIDTEIDEIKAMLAAGAVVAVAEEIATTDAEEEVVEEVAEEPAEEEVVEEVAEEIAEEEVVEEVAEEPAEEEVVEEVAEEPAEEEVVEEVAEEPAEEEVVEEVAEEIAEEEVVEEVAEEPAEEEVVEEVAEEPAEEEVVEEVAAAEEVVEEEAEEEIPTVSDVVEEVEEEIPTVSDVVEEEVEEAEEDSVIDEIVEDIDEEPAEGEIMPDGIPGISNGVDFINMMKYNRSFIARIIQGDDDVKQYYGQTKNALLSYKKVNSSVAWGAERFNKGRETIARFKIRGKTLCLYLALDPNEYKKSVYHHADVTNNKSMKGTPMMVKIKSPLGVKKAIRLIDDMLEKRNGVKQNIKERDYAAMYPYQTIEELIEDGLVKDVSKK